MSALKWLNNFLFIENLLGIYRNYCNQKKIKKCLIILQILMQTITHAMITIAQEFNLLKGAVNFQIKFIFACYSVLAFVNSVSSVLTGICYSGEFMSYYRSINRVSECFKDDKIVNYSLKKIMWFSIAIIIISMLTHLVRTTEIIIRFSSAETFIIFVPLLVSLTFTKVTIAFQYLVFFTVIKIVVNLFKCLISLILGAQQRVKCFDISTDGSGITREQIQYWVELYRELVNCCEKVTLCFGRQYFFSIVLSIIQYILLMYQIFYLLIFKVGTSYQQLSHKIVVVILFSYCLVLMMPLVAGQMARNQGVKLHRALVRLYNIMIIDSSKAEVKLIKDFIRLIKKNPIDIKLSTKIPAGMYLLPVILTLGANYVIVMLQFNHII